MNKIVLSVGPIFLAVAVTVIVLPKKSSIRVLAGGQQVAQPHPTAATAPPEQEAESAHVTLTGITTIPSPPLALLRVKWPASRSNREASYTFLASQSQDGLTLDSVGVTNATVTLKEGRLTRTLTLKVGTQS